MVGGTPLASPWPPLPHQLFCSSWLSSSLLVGFLKIFTKPLPALWLAMCALLCLCCGSCSLGEEAETQPPLLTMTQGSLLPLPIESSGREQSAFCLTLFLSASHCFSLLFSLLFSFSFLSLGLFLFPSILLLTPPFALLASYPVPLPAPGWGHQSFSPFSSFF